MLCLFLFLGMLLTRPTPRHHPVFFSVLLLLLLLLMLLLLLRVNRVDLVSVNCFWRGKETDFFLSLLQCYI